MNVAYGIPLGGPKFEGRVNEVIEKFAAKGETTRYDLIDKWPDLRYGETEATHLLIGSSENEYNPEGSVVSITWLGDNVIGRHTLQLLNERNFIVDAEVALEASRS